MFDNQKPFTPGEAEEHLTHDATQNLSPKRSQSEHESPALLWKAQEEDEEDQPPCLLSSFLSCLRLRDEPPPPSKLLAPKEKKPFRFMDLPLGVRQLVYEEVLVCANPIEPHLCSGVHSRDKIEFHDENQEAHNAIQKLLPITRVSKEVRQESLKIFYGSNTFGFSNDQYIYFDHLRKLNRFHLVLRVNFYVHPLRHTHLKADRALARTLYALQLHERYKKGITSKKPEWSHPLEALKDDPLYIASGDKHNGFFFLLRQLANPIAGAPSKELPANTRELVLHSSTVDAFDPYLEWFVMVLNGLRIRLKLYGKKSEPTFHHPHLFHFEWRRRHQKQADPDFTVDDSLDNLLAHAKMVCPGVVNVSSQDTIYYRKMCPSYMRDSPEWARMRYRNPFEESTE